MVSAEFYSRLPCLVKLSMLTLSAKRFKAETRDGPVEHQVQLKILNCCNRIYIASMCLRDIYDPILNNATELKYAEIVGDVDGQVPAIPAESLFVPVNTAIAALGTSTAVGPAREFCIQLRNYLCTEYPASIADNVADGSIVLKFKLLDELIRKKDISYREFQNLLCSLYDMGRQTGREWTSGYVRRLTELEFDQVYLIYEEFNHYIELYDIRLVTARLIAFINATIKIDRPENVSNKIVHLTKHRIKNSNPLYAMSVKRMQQHFTQRRKLDLEALVDPKLKFVRDKSLVVEQIRPIPRNRVMYAARESLEPDVAGCDWKNYFQSVSVKANFIMELANRDLMKIASVFAKLEVG